MHSEAASVCALELSYCLLNVNICKESLIVYIFAQCCVSSVIELRPVHWLRSRGGNTSVAIRVCISAVERAVQSVTLTGGCFDHVNVELSNSRTL